MDMLICIYCNIIQWTHSSKPSDVLLSANADRIFYTRHPGISLEMRIAIITARLVVKKHMHRFKIS